MRILDQEEITRHLAELPGWSGDTEGLTLEHEAPDFPAAIALVDEVALIAEELGHHPDIDIRWRTVRFRVTTHDAGGVTDLDISLVGKIDEVIGRA